MRYSAEAHTSVASWNALRAALSIPSDLGAVHCQQGTLSIAAEGEAGAA